MAILCVLTQNTVVLIGFTGAYLSIVISLLFDSIGKIKLLGETNQILGDIIHNQHVLDFYKQSFSKLSNAANYTDPMYKRLLENKLNEIGTELTIVT